MPNSELQGDLDTTLRSRCTTLRQRREEVSDVVPGMPVEASSQPLLVEEVSNQTNAAAEHEETVEDTHLQVVLSLLSGEGTAVAHQVNETDGNAAVDVENKVVLLGRCDSLDGESIVKQLGVGEVLLDVLLDELDTEVGVVSGLDPMADTGDWGRLAVWA